MRSHPILLLVLLTPGIPEYLSGSSSWAVLFANPIGFSIFVLLNIGLYTTGLILIRETVLRWRKGWASIFLMGVAYGIVEEGIALQTLFNSNAGPVGNLGYYGHWLGVNWVWTIGLLLFHSTISIGLPILLFGLALPDLKRKSLISQSRQALCMALMALDCIILYGIVRYWPGPAIMIGSFLAVFGLIATAYKVPASLGRPTSYEPANPRKLLTIGLLFFPLIFLVGGIGAGTGIPPAIPFVLEGFFAVLLAMSLRNSVGQHGNEKQKVALALGLVSPIIGFGLIASIGFTLVADVIFVGLFMRHLWKRYPGTVGGILDLSSSKGIMP